MFYHVVANEVTVSSGTDQYFTYELPDGPFRKEWKSLWLAWEVEPVGTPTTFGAAEVMVDFGLGERRIKGTYTSNQAYETTYVVELPLPTKRAMFRVLNSGQDTDVKVTVEIRAI